MKATMTTLRFLHQRWTQAVPPSYNLSAKEVLGCVNPQAAVAGCGYRRLFY